MLRAGCSKAEPKIFGPLQTPFPGARNSQNLVSLKWSLPSPTNPVWWGSMHTISSYHGNRPTPPICSPVANRQDRLQYTVPQLACSVKTDRYLQRKKIKMWNMSKQLGTLCSDLRRRVKQTPKLLAVAVVALASFSPSIFPHSPSGQVRSPKGVLEENLCLSLF